MEETFLSGKLEERASQHALRRLRLPEGKIDFCSNDYLGIIRNGLIESYIANDVHSPVEGQGLERSVVHRLHHGSGGSRLLAGNYTLVEETERLLAAFHQAPAGLIFNSGYDANVGLLSCVPQRGDIVLYDSLSHASIRDGIRLSFARSFSFPHNDMGELENALLKIQGEKDRTGTVFVVTESVFSMDGDMAPLREMAALCERYRAYLLVDEAHATGVIGPKGEGLVQELGLETQCLARVHTFGKAVGCHGAVILGSEVLRNYLINFSRPFIYTTALPESSVWAIRTAYELFPRMDGERAHLLQLIERFREAPLPFTRLDSRTPIQVVIIPGNEAVRALAGQLQDQGLDVRPILYPTVPRGSERLRIVLHAFNTMEELEMLIKKISRLTPETGLSST